MPELKRVFNAGKMNRDLDDRLVPPGEYREALNVNIGRSEGSDVGAVENLLGNSLAGATGLTDARCIGSYRDNGNERNISLLPLTTLRMRLMGVLTGYMSMTNNLEI